MKWTAWDDVRAGIHTMTEWLCYYMLTLNQPLEQPVGGYRFA